MNAPSRCSWYSPTPAAPPPARAVHRHRCLHACLCVLPDAPTCAYCAVTDVPRDGEIRDVLTARWPDWSAKDQSALDAIRLSGIYARSYVNTRRMPTSVAA